MKLKPMDVRVDLEIAAVVTTREVFRDLLLQASDAILDQELEIQRLNEIIEALRADMVVVRQQGANP